jgi:O-antigen/teichoic acid export membrane protein
MKIKSIKDILSKSSKVFILRVISIISGFYLMYLITNIYGSEGMGVFALSQTILMIMVMFSVFGTDTASLKYCAEYFSENNYNKLNSFYFRILKFVLILSIGFSIIIFFTRAGISVFFNEQLLSQSLFFISLSILPMSFININSESLRGVREYNLYTSIRYVLVPLFAILFIYILNNNSDILTPIKAYVLSIYLISFISFIFWFKKIKVFKYFSNINSNLNDLVKFSFPVLISNSMLLLIQWVDIIILGYFETSNIVGIYSVIMKISLFSSIILFSINSIVASEFSRLYSLNKMDDLKLIIRKSSKVIFFITIPILIFIVCFSEFILGYFGTEFVAANKTLYILIIGQFINILCGSVGYILMMTDKQSVFKNIMIFSTFINIIMNIILIPLYSINGAAIASSVSLILWNILSFSYIYRKYNISTIWFIK